MADPKLYTLTMVTIYFLERIYFSTYVVLVPDCTSFWNHTLLMGAETLIYRATDQQLIMKNAFKLIYVQMGNNDYTIVKYRARRIKETLGAWKS